MTTKWFKSINDLLLNENTEKPYQEAVLDVEMLASLPIGEINVRQSTALQCWSYPVKIRQNWNKYKPKKK